MARLIALAAFIFLRAAAACTCVSVARLEDPVRAALKSSTAVFRATVVSSDLLPERTDMRGRRRYRITMRVAESWKGNVGATVTLHDLEPGMDCMGSDLRIGKEYLLFTYQESAEDHVLEP